MAGCIPFRNKGNGDGADGVEVMLVTRRCGAGWIFPKGGWETDEQTAEEAAVRETAEEAGVLGVIEEPLVGTFPFLSQKRCNSKNGKCLAYMYALKVVKELDVWPENQERQRRWFSVLEVCNICAQPWMRQALYNWAKHRGWDNICAQLELVDRLVVPNTNQPNGLSNSE